MCYWFFLIPVFHLMYPMLLVSLDCPFLDGHSGFSNVYKMSTNMLSVASTRLVNRLIVTKGKEIYFTTLGGGSQKHMRN